MVHPTKIIHMPIYTSGHITFMHYLFGTKEVLYCRNITVYVILKRQLMQNCIWYRGQHHGLASQAYRRRKVASCHALSSAFPTAIWEWDHFANEIVRVRHDMWSSMVPAFTPNPRWSSQTPHPLQSWGQLGADVDLSRNQCSILHNVIIRRYHCGRYGFNDTLCAWALGKSKTWHLPSKMGTSHTDAATFTLFNRSWILCVIHS